MVHDLDWKHFVAEWETQSKQGMRLTNVQVYRSAGPDLYTGVFTKGASYSVFGHGRAPSCSSWVSRVDEKGPIARRTTRPGCLLTVPLSGDEPTVRDALSGPP